MITVIHGDDTQSSRNYFYSEKQKLKAYKEIDGETLLFSQFFHFAQSSTLFNLNPTLCIENFITENKLSDFNQIVDFINKNKKTEIIFWESSELNRTQQLLLKDAIFKPFTYPKNMFLFLDNIKPGNTKFLISEYKKLKKTTQDEITLFMLIRQIRLMISLFGDSYKNIEESKRLATWQVSKLKRQMGYFSQENLLYVYNKLFELDFGIKTGKLPISYEKSIDFLLASL